MPRVLAHRRRRKPPFFHPVPVRLRSDGGSELRQCAFLAELYLTGSASEAKRRVGMSRASAYRPRGQEDAADFACAWDAVLTPPGSGRLARPKRDWRKVTTRALIERLEAGLVRPVLYHGRMTAIRRKPNKSALFRLLGRADAGCATLNRRDAGR